MVRDLLLEIIFVNSGDAMLGSGCSQEHPDLKKKIIYIYINLNFIICLPIKKKKRNALSKIKNTLNIFMTKKF